MRLFRLILISTLLAVPLGADIRTEVDRAIAGAGLENAVWSIRVETGGGEIIHDLNGDTLVVPASVRKLFTAFAVAQCRGFDGTLTTDVLVDGEVRDGVLYGDLVLRGKGDPSFVSRYWPVRDAALRPLADALRRNGIVRVAGAVVGDGSSFDELRYPIGWKASNLGESYAPPIEALAFNENVAGVWVRPGDCRQSIVLTDPHFLPIEDATDCGKESLRIGLGADNIVQVRGSTSSLKRVERDLPSVKNASLYAAQGVDEYLRREGFAIGGSPYAVTTPRAGVLLHAFESPTMHTLLGTMLEASSNLYAEMLLKGLSPAFPASYEGALAIEKHILEELVGLEEGSFRFTDGSGLSVEDWVSSASIVGLVRAMLLSKDVEVWRELLATPGEGTLEKRLRELDGRLWAKTGSLNGVRALAGWLIADDGEIRVFSIVTNHAVPSWRATETVDAIVRAIARN